GGEANIDNTSKKSAVHTLSSLNSSISAKTGNHLQRPSSPGDEEFKVENEVASSEDDEEELGIPDMEGMEMEIDSDHHEEENRDGEVVVVEGGVGEIKRVGDVLNDTQFEKNSTKRTKR
ncbi:hypothetical protein MMC30_008183, partial [Trapelia coarctata]|nr:hypothetical protein [Trapelia coarctata]